MVLNVSRKLVNSKFEGYKLSDWKPQIQRINLSKKARRKLTLWGNQANLLAPSGHFIDEAGNVIDIKGAICWSGNSFFGALSSVSGDFACNSTEIINYRSSLTKSVFELTGLGGSATLLDCHADVLLIWQEISKEKTVISHCLSVVKWDDDHGQSILLLQVFGKSLPKFARIINIESAKSLAVASRSKFKCTNCIESPEYSWSQSDDEVVITTQFGFLSACNKDRVVSFSLTDQTLSCKTSDTDFFEWNLWDKCICEETTIQIGETIYSLPNFACTEGDIAGSTIVLTLKKRESKSWDQLFVSDVVEDVDVDGDFSEDEFNCFSEETCSSSKLLHLSIFPLQESSATINEFSEQILAISGSSKFFHLGIQNDVDLLVFELNNNDDKNNLTHVSSFDAFGYIIAGKSDRKYVTFTSDWAIIIESNRRVFFYKANPLHRSHSEQYVLDLGLVYDDASEILGFKIVEDEKVLVILTENSIFTINML